MDIEPGDSIKWVKLPLHNKGIFLSPIHGKKDMIWIKLDKPFDGKSTFKVNINEIKKGK